MNNDNEFVRDLARITDDTPAKFTELRTRLAAAADRDGILDVAYRIVDSPVGPLLVAATERGLVRVAYAREGHDAVAANVVLTDPDGRPDGWHRMHEAAPGTDRYEAWVQADRPGEWTFHVEAWDDPVATWYMSG